MAVTDLDLQRILDGLVRLPEGPWHPDIQDAFDPDDGSHDGTFCEGVLVTVPACVVDDGGYEVVIDSGVEELDIRDEDVARHVARMDPDTVRAIVEDLAFDQRLDKWWLCPECGDCVSPMGGRPPRARPQNRFHMEAGTECSFRPFTWKDWRNYVDNGDPS